MQSEFNEHLSAWLGKLGLGINGAGSATAYFLNKMSFEPTAVNISIFIAFLGLLLQIVVQFHAWRVRAEERRHNRARAKYEAERDRRAQEVHELRLEKIRQDGFAAMDSTLEAFNREAG